MHAKNRNASVQLYRSSYVRKGAGDNNTHGYSKQKFVGSLPIDAQCIPPELYARLTDAERCYVEGRVIEPARQRAEDERLREEAHARDPNWRIEEATRLLRVAGELPDAGPGKLTAVGTAAVREALESLGVFTCPKELDGRVGHPLRLAVEALHAATRAINEGGLGKAPVENMKETEENRLWTEIKAEMDALMRALQAAGFVKKKAG